MATSKKSIEVQVAEIIDDNEGNLTADQIAEIETQLLEAAPTEDEIVNADDGETVDAGLTGPALDPFTEGPGELVEVTEPAPQSELEVPAVSDPEPEENIVVQALPTAPKAVNKVTMSTIGVTGEDVRSTFGELEDGTYAGGYTLGIGIEIRWQNGLVPTYGWNGATVEDVLTAASQRLRYFQGGRFACDENAEAIGCIERAIAKLNERTLARRNAGVEGTYEKH